MSAQIPENSSANLSNAISLDSKDGKITNVNIYPSRAYITRVFKVHFVAGQNHVVVSGLPIVLDNDSIRLEGGGDGILQDITITEGDRASASKSPKIEALIQQIDLKKIAIKRKEKTADSLVSYLSSMNIDATNIANIRNTVQNIGEVAGEFNESLAILKKELRKLESEMEEEKKKTEGKTVIIGVLSKREENVDVSFHYAVEKAGWTPVYDVRVDTKSKDIGIKLAYKASISQNTGEDWPDARLTLETSLPQVNATIPPLTPWKLSFSDPRNRGQLFSYAASGYQTLEFDKGDANALATFKVPDLKTISGNGDAYKVTVAELELNGEISWVSIPTLKDVRMYWTAAVRNESEYPLLKGSALVYVNGSFTARSEIPYVSPQERFDCALGVDPTIRVIYHPRDKKRSQSGFYTKSNVNIFEQRITVINTKSCAVDNVKIIDHIPVSEESTISVKLLSPALPGSTVKGQDTEDVGDVVQVAKGVFAQWGSGEDDDSDKDGAGEGKISWKCEIPAQGRVNLVMSWEVSAPADKIVSGL